jgi:dienelactone hydrolase
VNAVVADPPMSDRGFTETLFEHGSITHRLFWKGAGRAVVVIHELPGMTPQCLALADRLVAAGFTVFLPLLFGEPGDSKMARFTLQLCISREFCLMAAGGGSPIVDWLRAVCAHAKEQRPEHSVGVIGMCLTGNFAIALMTEPAVSGAVAAEPSLPMSGPFGRHALAVSKSDIDAIRSRTKSATALACFRFTHDKISPPERFQAIQAALGDQFSAISDELPSGPGNPHDIPTKAHAVLTNDFVDRAGHPTRKALDDIIRFLHSWP